MPTEDDKNRNKPNSTAGADQQPVQNDVPGTHSHGSRVRRINGTWVFIAMITVVVFVTYRPSFETVDCTPDIIARKPDVVMLGAWWCGYCKQAKQYFHYNKISYCEYDMEYNNTGKRLYEENGGGAIPVLMIGDYVLKGFNENHIEEALQLLREAEQ